MADERRVVEGPQDIKPATLHQGVLTKSLRPSMKKCWAKGRILNRILRINAMLKKF